MNTKLFLLINAAPDASKEMIALATFFAEYLIYAPIVIILFCWFKKTITRTLIMRVIITVLITLAITALLRTLIFSPRPFDMAIGTNFLSHTSSNSFPSKHAAFIFAITFALFYGQKKQIIQKVLFIGCLSIALLVGWSRIYLGVHWPLDIFAGIVVSFSCAYLVNWQWANLTRVLSTFSGLFPPVINKLKIVKHVIKNSN